MNKKHNINKYEKKQGRQETASQAIKKRRSLEANLGVGIYAHFNRLR